MTVDFQGAIERLSAFTPPPPFLTYFQYCIQMAAEYWWLAKWSTEKPFWIVEFQFQIMAQRPKNGSLAPDYEREVYLETR